MKLGHVLVAFAASLTSASAQQVVFQDGFEIGFENWDTTGLWHLTHSTSGCGQQAAPFPQGTQAARFGNASGPCNYATSGHYSAGVLTLLYPIQLPDSPSISLHFQMWSETEYCYGPGFPGYDVFDQHYVVVNSGPAIQLCAENSQGYLLLPWHERRVDLSSYRGTSVTLSFWFDSEDDQANSGLGWLVDDIRILAEPGTRVCPGSFDSNCPCQPWYVPVAGGCRNSTNESASLYSSGSVSVAADTLQFRVEHMPPNASALLNQATASTTPTVFGDGIRCVAGQVIRLGIVQASNGVATWPPPGTPPISQRGAVPAGGGTRYYSVFYRDVMNYCASDSFNLTDTQRIQWVP